MYEHSLNYLVTYDLRDGLEGVAEVGGDHRQPHLAHQRGHAYPGHHARRLGPGATVRQALLPAHPLTSPLPLGDGTDYFHSAPDGGTLCCNDGDGGGLLHCSTACWIVYMTSHYLGP